ncbi:MAG: tape measure protein, partial [Gemmatimonadota bacterium]
MASAGTIDVTLRANLRGFERALDSASARLERTGRQMQRVGRTLSLAVTAPVAALGAASIKAAADFDALREGLRAVTGSATEANRQFERLRDLAKLPSVTLDAAAEASIAFQSIGQSAEFAERAVRGVGNAVALSGGGAGEFAGVMRQLRQVASLGRLMGEEMNVSIENAPAMAGAIQQAFGTTSAEAIREMGLSSEEFFERLFQGMEALPRSTGGARTALENVGLALRQAAAAIGE